MAQNNKANFEIVERDIWLVKYLEYSATGAGFNDNRWLDRITKHSRALKKAHAQAKMKRQEEERRKKKSLEWTESV